MDETYHVAVLVALIALGAAAQWVAWRARIPAIVPLAIAGLAVGPGLDLVDPSLVFGEWLRPIISLCVAIILFEGGLNLQVHELKVAARGVRRLVYVGAPLAWVTCSLAAWQIGGLSWPVSLVFGAIMVVTGPTVIMPMLRHAGLLRRSASYLKWEGIINDPIGALLAVLVFQFFLVAGAGPGWSGVLSGLGLALLAAALFGGLGGWLAGKAYQRGLVPEYLKSPLLLALVLVVYALSNFLQHEAGLVSVTVMGIVIGNMSLPAIEDIRRFKEYISLMLVAIVFLLLTADLDVGVVRSLDWRSVALIAAVLFLARPLTVLLATMRAGMQWQDRALLAWIAPRGIVAGATAGVMGPRLAEAGYAGAEQLLPLVFAVIFATVFAHGLSIGWLARRLGLASRHRDGVMIVGASPWAVELGRALKEFDVSVLVADNSWHNLKAARLAGLPVFYGEILSDFADESLEISHISTVLAATSNDAYNALVCTALAPDIGRANVFQLPMGKTREDDDPRAVARTLRGQLAFGPEAVFEQLWSWHVRGWKFNRTKLSEDYGWDDFQRDKPDGAIAVMALGAEGRVSFCSPMREQSPGPGDTVLYYAPHRIERSHSVPAAGERDADDEGEPVGAT